MEKGQMRLEPNISLRTKEMLENDELPNYKVEIKNINSFRFMEKAIEAEIKRQREVLESGETPIQENRGYIEEEKKTVSQRTKEHAHDYRYFPEPDIPPLVFDENYLDTIKEEYEKLKEKTPSAQKKKALEEVQLSEDIKERLVSELSLKNNKTVARLASKGFDAENVANHYLNRPDYREMTMEDVEKELKREKDKLSDEDELSKVIKKVVSENGDAVESYRGGKDNALQFLMGMVMRETKGKAEAEKTRKMLLEQLKS
jgi:aspartyl-tRNA(Asn)/glutamyl-tRNA(Gln) amidotransferase subunit B